ncbi:MAG: ATP-binding protein [Candidatus Kuenenbacteria bacterium]
MNNAPKYIKRSLFDKVSKHLDNKEITVITGPRQVGKTILLKQLQEYLTQEKKTDPRLIFYFNLDIIKDRELFDSQTEFIEFIREKSRQGKIYVFIDEAQKVKEAAVFFKGVYDSDLPVKLILTGSSTLEIRDKIHESLTGRKRVFHLLPLSFIEILSWCNPALFELVKTNKKIIKYDHQQIFKYFSDYCIYGGYPQVVLAKEASEKESYLNEIFSSYIEKDIIGFLKIENESNFIKLVKLLAAQIGNLVNVAEVSALVNTDRYSTDRYLSNLAKTFVTYNLRPFYSNARQEIVKAFKIYFIDNGLRNLSLGKLNQSLNERIDKGELLENVILKELLILQSDQLFNLKFWRSKQKAEVDFIIEKGLDIMPMEIKSNISSSKLSKSFLGFIERYKPRKALVVNLNYQGQRKIGKTKIFFIYPYEIESYL